MKFLFFFLQTDDVNLVPPIGEGTFEFDPSAQIPNEGFKF